LLTKKVAKEITPVSLRKPAKNQKFEAPPKLGKRYRRLPQTVGVLKPQTFNFYRLGLKGRKSAGWGIGVSCVASRTLGLLL